MCRIWWNVRLEVSQLQPHLLHYRPDQANPNQQWQDSEVTPGDEVCTLCTVQGSVMSVYG